MQVADVTTCKALNNIGPKHSKETDTTKHWANWLLDYLENPPKRENTILAERHEITHPLRRVVPSIVGWKK